MVKHRGITLMKKIAFVAAVTALALIMPAHAADKLRVGNPVPTSFSFMPMSVGLQKGFFTKNGLDIDYTGFAGSAKVQQALIADAIDIAVSSGPEFPFLVKGAPELAIAAVAGPPLVFAVFVRADSPIKSAKELRGKKIAISTVGSVSEWLVREIARQQGWGPDGIDAVAVGGVQTMVAGLMNSQVDAVMSDVSIGWDLEEKGRGRVILYPGEVAPDFIMNAIYASNKIIASSPDVVRRFLAGWFETIRFMRANKAETVQIATSVMGVNEGLAVRTYDHVMPMFSSTGRFEPKAVKTLARSFVDIGALDTEPDLTKYYTEKFLPASIPAAN
jgi:NitT/TauT family transport system substrate-binding protein